MFIEDKRFTIKIMGKVFESDGSGMLDLNDIWRGCNLPDTRRPSQWRGKIVDELRRYADLQTVENPSLTIKVSTTKGNRRASIAYAMWVSFEFYCEVLDAFVNLSEGNIERAIEIAAGTMSKEDEHLLLKFAAQKGLCFTKSCWYANIDHPNKLLNYLKRNINWKYFGENQYGKLYATDEGIEQGIVYNCYGDRDSSKVVMRFTQKGRELLRNNNKYFNSKVQENFEVL
jgi:hypothetical protein